MVFVCLLFCHAVESGKYSAHLCPFAQLVCCGLDESYMKNIHQKSNFVLKSANIAEAQRFMNLGAIPLPAIEFLYKCT